MCPSITHSSIKNGDDSYMMYPYKNHPQKSIYSMEVKIIKHKNFNFNLLEISVIKFLLDS
jgi:hypothetical protein